MTEPSDLVCDLRHAPDSPAQRAAAYSRLFSALLGRTSSTRGLRFRFDADRVDRALLDELVALERACCPFLRSRVSTSGGEVRWDLAVDSDEAAAFLDALHDLPDTLPPAGSGDTTEPVVLAGRGVRFRLPQEAGPH